jgi:DNA repair exonuclease SbcCD nuclease subunit
MTSNLSSDKARERKKELLQTFVRMVNYGSRNNVKAVIIAGDLFDTRKISVTAQNVIKQTIIENPDIDFYYLQGNHDSKLFLDSFDQIPDNLKLFGSKWTFYETGTNDNIVITGIEPDENTAGSLYNALTLDAGKINIVVMHGQESFYPSKDRTEIINIKELRNKGIDYLALGHIHEYKREALDARGIYCYPGCLEGRGFDECGLHGFVLLDIDEMTGKIKDKFIPFARRNIYTIYIDVSNSMTSLDISNKINERLNSLSYSPDSLVKLVLTGNVDVECEKDIDFLLKQYENRFYFLKIYDETLYKVDYASFLYDESLKGEFIRQVMSASDICEDDRAEVIRCGLKALAGEEI